MNPLQLPFLGLFVSAPSLPFERKKYVWNNRSRSFEARTLLAINQYIDTIRNTPEISEHGMFSDSETRIPTATGSTSVYLGTRYIEGSK